MKQISQMNQSELILYAYELENGESGRTFEESANYYRNGNSEMADKFDAMAKRWWELE